MSNGAIRWLAGLLATWSALSSAALAETPAKAKTTIDSRREQIRQAVSTALVKHKVPGAGVAVVENYQIAWAEGFGRRATANDDPVQPTTRFQAASISKPVTALAMLTMVQKGELDLDDDVNKRLKSWHLPENPIASGRMVTLRQLLSHTAGLSVHGFGGYAVDAPCPTLLQVLDGIPPANSTSVQIVVKPGYQFRYSGGGYCVVQQLAIDATGTPFPDFMKAQVLDPLAMEHSTYQQPLPADLVDQAAFGHRADGSLVPGNYHVYPEMAAAGLWTTPSDLAKVVIDLSKSISEWRRQIAVETNGSGNGDRSEGTIRPGSRCPRDWGGHALWTRRLQRGLPLPDVWRPSHWSGTGDHDQ